MNANKNFYSYRNISDGRNGNYFNFGRHDRYSVKLPLQGPHRQTSPTLDAEVIFIRINNCATHYFIRFSLIVRIIPKIRYLLRRPKKCPEKQNEPSQYQPYEETTDLSAAGRSNVISNGKGATTSLGTVCRDDIPPSEFLACNGTDGYRCLSHNAPSVSTIPISTNTTPSFRFRVAEYSSEERKRSFARFSKKYKHTHHNQVFKSRINSIRQI